MVLNFHGLGTPDRSLESGEAPYWVSRDHFAETLALADRLSDRVETSFTFDDGNLSDIEIAAPLLGLTGRTATFFVLANRIGAPGSLDADALRQLVAEGHRIGCHGAAHVDWRTLDTAGQNSEWRDARVLIAEASGQKVDDDAIPFGRYDGRVIRGLKAEGFACAWSSDGGAWRSGAFLRPRTSPRNDMTIADIEAILLGHEPALRSWRRRLAMAVKQRV